MSRKTFLAGAMVLAASIAGLTVSSPASAAALMAPSDCPKGAVCFYANSNYTSRLGPPHYGNWSGALYGARSVYNNGKPEDFDHVMVDYTYQERTPEGVETRWARNKCVHQDAGLKLNTGNVGRAATLRDAEWVQAWRCD